LDNAHAEKNLLLTSRAPILGDVVVIAGIVEGAVEGVVVSSLSQILLLLTSKQHELPTKM
jgi:hypothetical protein